MRKLSWWTAVLAAALIAAVGAYVSVRAQTTADIENAAAEAVRTLDLQIEMPTKPKQLKDLGAFDLADYIPGNLIGWLFWGMIILGAILLVYAFREYIYIPAIMRRNSEQWGTDDNANGANVPSSAAEAETAADELARQGKYMEAMHVLLLRAVTELRMRLNEHYADSLTSREIMRRARITESGRKALREIITRVEWTYFGAYPAEVADYTACRENFTQLISGLENAGRS